MASTDKLEISVEYSSSTTLLEATGTSQNASEMLLDASNAGIVRASPDKSVHSPLPGETADHEALLEATMAPEPQKGSLPDETQWLLPDKSNQTIPACADVNKTLQEATDATNHSIVQLTDKMSNVLSDDTQPNSTGLSEETAATKNRTSSSSESPDTSENLPLKGTEQPDHDGSKTKNNKTLTDITNQGSVSSEKPDNTTTELTNSLAEHDKTKSATTLSVPNLDVKAQPCQNEETMSASTTPLPLPLPEVETSKEQTDITETTTEEVIGEISYMECSDELHSVKSSSEIPINFKPVETSSVVSKLPEFSHTPDTTLTNMSNSSSGSSQGTSVSDKNNNDTSNLSTTVSSGSSQTKRKRLKTCIIRLTELSNQEQEQWISGSGQTTSTPSSTLSANDESSTGTNDSRYNMRARQRTSITSNRSTGWKRAMVNYAEQGNQDSGRDSDYEAKLKPPQPLDNKSYPSASQIATQRVIETNRASKQTSMPNTCSLPAATEPAQGSVQINKQTEDNKVLSEATTDLDALTIPDKTAGKTPDGPDETTTQPKNVLPDATSTLSPDTTKDNMGKPKCSADKSESRDSVAEKPVKGVFKTKTITIRRSKDPCTFKCSVYSTRASTLRELNAHFIQNHWNVDCDMCGKSFLTPASLRKH